MSDVQYPKVTLKLATSLDGRIATVTGESQWITCPESRNQVHKFRTEHDAIMVGVGTALADDPMLTARFDPEPNQQPIRIVVDSNLRTPLTHKLISTARQYRTVIACGMQLEEKAEYPFLDLGVDVWSLAIAPIGGVSIRALLARCIEEGINSILLEGGGKLAASFLKAELVDRIEWFRAPIIIGGDGISCLGSLGVERLDDTTGWKRTRLEESGLDVWESFARIY